MASLDDQMLAEISYTTKEAKHELEKPYELRFDTKEALPSTNTKNTSHLVAIRDFRSIYNQHNFLDYGFAVERIPRALTDAVFQDKESITSIYYPIMEELLWQKYPGATNVRVLEHNLRQRHEDFPSLDKDFVVEYSQPAPLAHIDYSLSSATQNACAIFAMKPENISRVITVNCWKSFTIGNDWPLALCDARSVDHMQDTFGVDIVYHNRFTETEKLYYNPKHEWYWVKDIADDEIIMFVQKDSEKIGGGGVPHASFYNPTTDALAPPRKSIEFRAYVMFQ